MVVVNDIFNTQGNYTLPNKGFLPTLSIIIMVMMFPGKLDKAVIKPSKNTQSSGIPVQLVKSVVLLTSMWEQGDPPYFSTLEKISGNHIHRP